MPTSLPNPKKYALTFLVFALASASVVFFTSASKKSPAPQKSKAEESVEAIQAELKTKPLSSVCAARSAQAITPFDSCPAGKIRLSSDSNNPLYNCCR